MQVFYFNTADIPMSSQRPPKPDRRHELLNRIWDLGRTMSTQTVFLHQALAQSVGLNATDTKCIDLILRAPEAAVSAGWLSDRTGLTSGAITHILDRLEKQQFVERLRDVQDRRKVLIRVRPETLRPLIPKYEAMGKEFLRVVEQYSDKELALICDYLRKTSEISERELAKAIAANRSRTPDATLVTSPHVRKSRR